MEINTSRSTTSERSWIIATKTSAPPTDLRSTRNASTWSPRKRQKPSMLVSHSLAWNGQCLVGINDPRHVGHSYPQTSFKVRNCLTCTTVMKENIIMWHTPVKVWRNKMVTKYYLYNHGIITCYYQIFLVLNLDLEE